jgi:N-acetylmuramoyl-L-alanine amidase
MAASTELPLRRGGTGDAVRDLQARLAALGFDSTGDGTGSYGTATERAVRAFQEQRGLRVDGACGRQTWSSLVEAGYRLGDRLLYLRQPMLRGDDVLELQRALGALGFDAGRVDGILGPNTTEALAQFQRNAGLTTDRICGPDSVRALRRFLAHVSDTTTVAHVREAERMRGSALDLRDRRLAVGEHGGLAALADAVGHALVDAGAVVAVLHEPDESNQATEANGFVAEAYLGLGLRDEPGVHAAFYATGGFESVGGHHLARLALEEVAATIGEPAPEPTGMRLAILRETRMPAVVCELGPPGLVVERTGALAEALARAIARWITEPLDA